MIGGDPLWSARTPLRAGDGNRTRIASLEGWGSTIELRPPAPPVEPLQGTCCGSPRPIVSVGTQVAALA